MVRLVLADDNLTIQKVVELSFAEDDIEVHSFAEGESALEYLRNQPTDVLLADVAVPLIDGYDLCRKVKRNPNTAHIAVVLLAGTFDPFDTKRAERAGCDGSLIKPFETSELVDLVKRLLGSSPSPEMVRQAEPRYGFEKDSTEKDSIRVLTRKEEQPASFPLMLGQLGPAFTPLGRDVDHLPPLQAVEPESGPSFSQFRTPASLSQENGSEKETIPEMTFGEDVDPPTRLAQLSASADGLVETVRALESYVVPLRQDSDHLERDLEGVAEAIRKASEGLKHVAAGLDKSADMLELATQTVARIQKGAKAINESVIRVRNVMESLDQGAKTFWDKARKFLP